MPSTTAGFLASDGIPALGKHVKEVYTGRCSLEVLESLSALLTPGQIF